MFPFGSASVRACARMIKKHIPDNRFIMANSVRKVVSPLWSRPGSMHVFTLDGKSYLLVTAQTIGVTTLSGVRITALI